MPEERILVSPSGRTCWKAILRGRSYSIFKGPLAAPRPLVDYRANTKAEAERRVERLEAQMRAKGYRRPDEPSGQVAPDPELPRFVKMTRAKTLKEYAAPVLTGFKVTKTASLEKLSTLAVVVYAHRRERELSELAGFVASVGLSASAPYPLQEVLALESRSCRDRQNAADARKWIQHIKDLGYNDHVLTLESIEHHDSFALHGRGPMTVAQEVRWRISMVKKLVLASELGGSRTLKAKDARRELDEHMAHLRAVWKIKQDASIERPAGRHAPYPIPSHLFSR